MACFANPNDPMTGELLVDIQLFEEFAGLLPVQWLKTIAGCALEAESGSLKAALSVVVADDETVRELNSRHRALDETTDVLSFSPSHQGEYYGSGEAESRSSDDFEFILPPGDEAGLGEVVISYPQALRQSVQAGHTVEKEVAVLLIHGILHLLGHDHMEPEEAGLMKAAEARVLARLAGEGVA